MTDNESLKSLFWSVDWEDVTDDCAIDRFIELVRADERERCVDVAKNCAAFNSSDRSYAMMELIKAIRKPKKESEGG